METRIQNVVVHYDNIEPALHTDKKGTIRNFRMYIGLGSDGSSANKLSLDLKFNPCDTAITFRPEWRSMSNTVFTQYDPLET